MNNTNLFQIFIHERVARDSSVFPVSGLSTLVVLRVYVEREGKDYRLFNTTQQIKTFALECFS